MKRRTLLASAAITPLLAACSRDTHFDLSWDEEVQLHDGRVIVVHVKHTYERIGQGFFTSLERIVSPYAGMVLPRDTTLTFDAGGTTGKVTQLFKGFHPMFLGQYQGVWYAVLYGSYYYQSNTLPGQDWGALEGPYGQWAIKLEQGKWTPISMSRLPDLFQEPNMLMLYGEPNEHAHFDGGRVAMQDKAKWLVKHPPGYSDVRLTRPTAASPRRVDSITNLTTGEQK